MQTAGHVLYLDYDGVLHPDEVYRFRDAPSPRLLCPGHGLFESTPVLVDALGPYPEVRIVLSTSWVRVFGYERTRSYLPPALGVRVIGATFHARFHDRREFEQATRLAQVLGDVDRRRPRRWLALDDQIPAWPAACDGRIVRVPSTEGLASPAAAADLRARLAAEFGSDRKPVTG